MNLFTLVAKLVLDSSEFDKGTDEAEQKAEGLGGKLKGALSTGAKVGVAALTAAGTAATFMTKELVQGVGQVASYGDNIDKMSQKLGMSAEAYQEWDAILQHSGASIESMSGAMKTMALAAESDSDAFKKLGISEKEVSTLSQEDLFKKVVTGLQEMGEGSERTALATKLLGRGAVELGALLNTSAEDTEAMRQKVHELGGVLSDEAVKSAAAYQDSLQDMQTAFAGLKNGLFAEFLPSFTTVINGLTELFGGDAGSGTEMIIEGIKSIGQGIEEAIPEIVEKGGQIVSGLIQMLIEGLPQFLDMGFRLLGQMIQGISNNLPNILKTIINVATQMLSSLMQRLPEFIAMGLKLIISLISGILSSIPDLLSALGDLIGQAADAFINYDWISLGQDIINGIVEGIKSLGSLIGSTLSGFAESAWKKVKGFFGISSPSKLMRDTIGKMIPEGIAIGIEAKADSVYDAMDDLSKMTVDAYNPEFGSVDAGITGGIGQISFADEIRSLKDAILGMQIILDTGATVGGLAPAMDTQLGSMSVYKGRGN